MTKKRNLLFIIIVLLAMILTGYSLFETVFDQIISQNEGFFYAIVFGGILILVYIFANIVSKLMIISEGTHRSKAIMIICFAALLGICALFGYISLLYQTSVSPAESDFYQAGQMINNGTLSVSSDLVSKLKSNPAQYVLALIYALLFNFISDGTQACLIINVVIFSLSAVFIYMAAVKVSDKLCALVAAALSLFMPSQMFAVYSFNTESIVALLFSITAYCAVVLWVDYSQAGSKKVIFTVIYGLVCGLLVFAEPVAVYIPILILIAAMISNHKVMAPFAVSIAIMLAVFLGMSFQKSMAMGEPYGEIVAASVNSFNNRTNVYSGLSYSASDIKFEFDESIQGDGRYIQDNTYFLIKKSGEAMSPLIAAWAQLGNQVLFMFVLILSLSALFSALQNNDMRIVPITLMQVSSYLIILFEVGRTRHVYFFNEILALTAALGFHYMYLNHHPEESFAWNKLRNVEIVGPSENEVKEAAKDAEDEAIKQQEFLARARALIFIDENENLYRMIKSEERRNVVRDVRFEEIKEIERIEETKRIEEAERIEELEKTEATERIEKTESVEEIRGTEEIQEIENVVGEVVSVDEIDEEPVTYLPNPLPVPVRKPHSAMDFEIDSDDDLDWDVSVDDDDFDIE